MDLWHESVKASAMSGWGRIRGIVDGRARDLRDFRFWIRFPKEGPMVLSRDHARLALATIRLVNGTLALVAPGTLLRRLGADPNANKVAIYPLRMFGIRTIVLGVQLLIDDPSPQTAKFGVLIHGTDAAAAITAGLRRQLPARVAVVTAGISLTNTALALIIASPENTDSA
jgi:hypothetical protein